MSGADLPGRPLPPPLPGSQFSLPAVEANLRSTITDLIHQSGLSHDQVAERLSDELGYQVTPDLLAKWRAASKAQYRIPAIAIIALCRVLERDDPLQILAHALGGKVFRGRQRKVAELANLEDFHRTVLQQIEDDRRGLGRLWENPG